MFRLRVVLLCFTIRFTVTHVVFTLRVFTMYVARTRQINNLRHTRPETACDCKKNSYIIYEFFFFFGTND